jgi:hypothetical protein
LCPAPLSSPFGPRCSDTVRAAQDQTRSSLAPRSPLPSPLLSGSADLPPSGEGAATSKAVRPSLMSPPPARLHCHQPQQHTYNMHAAVPRCVGEP